VLQQIVNVIDCPGTGVFQRHDGIIGLAGFNLIKDIVKFKTAALDKLLEMAGGILTRCQMRVRAFRAEEGDSGRMGINFVEMLLEQRLLRKNGVFDNNWNRRVI
jgi:hypothetical protein